MGIAPLAKRHDDRDVFLEAEVSKVAAIGGEELDQDVGQIGDALWLR